mmetsp:Transcript_15049/g.35260  ORF Transcript_15049/g.35260 Transcript_15049/m.35260 type:complete len:90 (+) Transcript_15049:155-424(+)|eukprot:CAMPEP_0171100056 /NCGR_PEP_ID=MMETSP0766_2-20121228/52727_1 /TAXON_ID=439317 /ORGANISM="Gambierdiscus australes, Strain CAWD 149" /LENGTH=89 /DNA_ID=CAMNT_0011559807 /DNA_START=129 /DNA_END=398 /DNA_ORIENTATION=+
MSPAASASNCEIGITQDTTVAVVFFILGYVLSLPRWRVAERLARLTREIGSGADADSVVPTWEKAASRMPEDTDSVSTTPCVGDVAPAL